MSTATTMILVLNRTLPVKAINSPPPNNFVDTSRGRNSLGSSNFHSTPAFLQEFGQDVASFNENNDALATIDLFRDTSLGEFRIDEPLSIPRFKNEDNE